MMILSYAGMHRLSDRLATITQTKDVRKARRLLHTLLFDGRASPTQWREAMRQFKITYERISR